MPIYAKPNPKGSSPAVFDIASRDIRSATEHLRALLMEARSVIAVECNHPEDLQGIRMRADKLRLESLIELTFAFSVLADDLQNAAQS